MHRGNIQTSNFNKIMKPGYFSDEEMEKSTSAFSKLSKENPFVVPSDYFDSLAENIQKKIRSLPDFEKQATQNPFLAPEGYFESLPSTIQQRISDTRNRNTIGNRIAFIFRPQLSLATAALVIIIIAGILYITRPTVVTAPDNFLSCEEVKNSSYLGDIDESMVIEVLEQQQKSNTVKEDNSLEQYLIDNDIDISQLENRL